MLKIRPICFLLFIALSSPVFAGALEVSPTKIYLTNNHRVRSLVFRNLDNHDVVLSLKTFAWQQANGKDEYQATNQILATPPIVKIKAGSSQIVRIGLISKLDDDREHAFRIYATEVIPRPKQHTNAVKIALRLGVPVFASAKAQHNAPMPLVWKLSKAKDSVTLTASNRDKVHRQLTQLSIGDGHHAEKPAWSHDIFSYILPGSSQQWTIPRKQLASLEDDIDVKDILISTKTVEGDETAHVAE